MTTDRRSARRRTSTPATSRDNRTDEGPRTVERLLPLLVDLHDGLAEDVKLRHLAARFGTSQFHFHRLFTDVIGETPKKHIERVRLERAAMLLAISNDPVLDVGLAVGFKNAETFTRRFKRFLGYTPSSYRRMAKAAQAKRLESVDFFSSDEYVLAPARFEQLPRMSLLASRRLGGYGALHDEYAGPSSPWDVLAKWAHPRRLAVMPLRIGIFYDDPTLTPAPSQRADLCVPVEGPVLIDDRGSVESRGPSEDLGPIENRGPDEDLVPATHRIRSIDFPGGMYGIIEYTGRKETIINAFRGLADEIRRSPRFDFADGPPLEIVRDTDVSGKRGVHRIDACFPVKRKRKPPTKSKIRQAADTRRP